MSGTAYVKRIQRWKEQGYQIWIYYLRLEDVEFAVQRVKERVASGGHDIPEPVVRRRYDQSWEYFNKVDKPLADCWRLYDNSSNQIKSIETSHD